MFSKVAKDVGHKNNGNQLPFLTYVAGEIRYPKTCMGWDSGKEDFINGTYTIDPDGEGGEEPFSVQCVKSSSSGTVWSSVSHDKEWTTIYGGQEDPFSNQVQINYTLSDDQLRALVNTSWKCQMRIDIHCHGMFITEIAGWRGQSGDQYLLSEILCPGKDIAGT